MPILPTIQKNKSAFRSRLLRWYDRNRRELPWRLTRDPYRIWVSEIMLQQTRVNAMLGHYRRFLERFPTVRDLAAASEAEVLAAWSGLGYYRRARRMRLAAQTIVTEHGGAFPPTEEGLRSLPGIGRYTAAAIASIAYDAPCAVVDGNVERVVERIAGKSLPQKTIWDLAQSVISARRPGDFNQAMMELGATVCTPAKPNCAKCPVRSLCRSQGELAGAKAKEVRRVAVLDYLFARKGDRVLLVQRDPQASLMAGMWELPQKKAGSAPPVLRLRHSITATDYRVQIHAGSSGRGRYYGARDGRWLPLNQVAALPLTGLARKVLTRLGAIASKA